MHLFVATTTFAASPQEIWKIPTWTFLCFAKEICPSSHAINLSIR